MFVKTLTDHLTIGERTYPKGSVVETDKQRRDELVRFGVGEDHPGPAFEPKPRRGNATPDAKDPAADANDPPSGS